MTEEVLDAFNDSERPEKYLSAQDFYDKFRDEIEKRPLLNEKFKLELLLRQRSRATIDILTNAINDRIGVILYKLNQPYDDHTVDEIGEQIIEEYFNGYNTSILGFKEYDTLYELSLTKGGWVAMYEELKKHEDLLAIISLALDDYARGNYRIISAENAADHARQVVEVNMKRAGYDLDDIQTSVDLLGSVIERETVLANTDTNYNRRISGKLATHERRGIIPSSHEYIRLNDVIYDILDDEDGLEIRDQPYNAVPYKGTLYKGYFKSGFRTKYQFKEIFVGDAFALSASGEIASSGVVFIGNSDASLLYSIKVYYERIRQFINYAKEDPDIIVLNVGLFFKSDRDEIDVIQQLTIPAYKFNSFGDFTDYLQDIIVRSSNLESGDYYTEANIPVNDLILDMFSISTTRHSYVYGASRAKFIPMLYETGKTSLTDGLCAFRMLNEALGMTIEEFNEKKLSTFDTLIPYLRDLQKQNAKGGESGVCFDDCSGEYFDELGCGECSSKPMVCTTNKIAVVNDAFYIDKNDLVTEGKKSSGTRHILKVTKCGKCIDLKCKCKDGLCFKCRKCKDCKFNKEAAEYERDSSYQCPKEINLKYLVGDENSEFKYVLSTNKEGIMHVEKMGPLLYPLNKLVIDGRKLRVGEKVIGMFPAIDSRAKEVGLAIANKSNTFKDLILLLDFESTTIRDKVGCVRQVCYSVAILALTPSELKKLSKADEEGDAMTIDYFRNKTQFILEKEICPAGYKNRDIVVDDIGQYLFDYLKGNAINNNKFTIVTFNGCAYDNLILHELLTSIDPRSVDNVFFSGTKLNNMLIFSTHTLFDLRRHHTTSLAKLCESFKVKSVAKTSFNHKEANIASSRGLLFEYLSESKGGMQGIVNYNKLDVMCMGVILSRFNDAIQGMNNSLPAILEPLSKAFANDKTALIGGTGEEIMSFKKIEIKDIWHYQTAPSFVMKLLRAHWRDCGFIVNNYDSKTISKEAYDCTRANKTVKVIKKGNRIKLQQEYKFYKSIMGDKVGGRVCMRYTTTIKDGKVSRVCKAMFFKGRRFSIDACSLYPGSGLIAPEYLPYGNRIESNYIPGDTRIGFFYCRIIQITENNNHIYRPLRISSENRKLYPNLVNPQLSNDWNNCEPIERVMIDTVEIDYLRRRGCIVQVLDEPGFYFTGKIKNFYMFAVLLAIMKVKDLQDKYAKLIKTGDAEAIANYNPAMRETAKLLMNAALGKLIMRVYTNKVKNVTFQEYESLIAENCDPTLLTSFDCEGKALCQYTVSEMDNMSQSMPCHLGIFIYGISKRHMNDTILFNLPDGVQFDYSDTDSMHCSEEVYDAWVKKVNDENILVPHWPELEEWFPEYKIHKLIESNSKVFLSFENELAPCINREIILGNKLYICYNEEWYNEQIAKHGKVILDDSTKEFCKVSSAGVNFNNYWVISNFNGLVMYSESKNDEIYSKLTAENTVFEMKKSPDQRAIERLNNGVLDEMEVKEFCYRNDPRRSFLECYEKGFIVLVREVFTRNVKENIDLGIKSSTVSVNVDMKLMKKIDFIDSKEDEAMMEIIKKYGIFSFLHSM